MKLAGVSGLRVVQAEVTERAMILAFSNETLLYIKGNGQFFLLNRQGETIDTLDRGKIPLPDST